MHPYDRITRDLNLKRIKSAFVRLKLCDRCDGTGNELYSMHRSCEKCNGTGTVTR